MIKPPLSGLVAINGRNFGNHRFRHSRIDTGVGFVSLFLVFAHILTIISGAIIKCMTNAEITKLSKDMQKGFADVDKKINGLDSKFSKRFDVAEKRTDKVDEQLDRLTKLVITGFDHVDKVLETKANAADIQRIFKILDDLSQRLEITEDERLVMASHVTALIGWVEKAAKRIDLKFVR